MIEEIILDGYSENNPMPTLQISDEEVLRNLAKCLKEMGLVESDRVEDKSGEIKRLENHLTDMQKLVFKNK